MDISDPENIEDFDRGYEDGCVAVSCGKKTGDIVGESDDYKCGFFVGAGDAVVVSEGYEAAERGVFFCPYGDEYSKKLWLSGYAEAVLDNILCNK